MKKNIYGFVVQEHDVILSLQKRSGLAWRLPQQSSECITFTIILHIQIQVSSVGVFLLRPLLYFFFLPVWLILRCITGLQEEQQLQSNPLETENFPQWALGSRIHTNYTHRHRDRETERERAVSIFVRTFIGVNIKGIMHFTSQSLTNPQYLRLSILT